MKRFLIGAGGLALVTVAGGAASGASGALILAGFYLGITALWHMIFGRSWITPVAPATRKQAIGGFMVFLALFGVGGAMAPQQPAMQSAAAVPDISYTPSQTPAAEETPSETPTPEPTPSDTPSPTPSATETPTAAPETTSAAPTPLQTAPTATNPAPATSPANTRVGLVAVPQKTTAKAVAKPTPKATTKPTVRATTKPVVRQTTNPAPRPTATKKATAPAKQPIASTGYYKNCAAARAAGVAPLHTGDPGYSRKLDRDGDGVACE